MLGPGLIREFVLAGHFNLDAIKIMLAQNAELLEIPNVWGPGDAETALQAAGHVGNRAIAEYLLSQGAKPEIGVMAMLGDRDAVEHFLKEDPAQANARVVHGFRVLYHAALSGDVGIAELLVSYGCTVDFDQALHGAVSKGHKEMAAWLLDHGVKDVNSRNYQEKTPLRQAVEHNYQEIAELLRAWGGVE